MDKYEAVFMPINDGQPSAAYSGTHWSLMVFIRATNSFYYYDTLRFNNLRDAELTCKRIQPLLKLDKPAQFIPSSAPQQDNGSDCGCKYVKVVIEMTHVFLVYVIAIIDYILERLLKSRGKEDVAYNKMMIIKPKYLSTPKQIRDNINGMIKRLQQRQLNKSHK